MTRTTGSKGENTLMALRAAGLERLYTQGFDGMTLRELAADVGMQAGSLYNHFTNKQDFLFMLMQHVMSDLISASEVKLEKAPNPRQALLAYVECHVTFHSERRKEVQVSTTELRSLTPENYRVIISMRDAYENQLLTILHDGNAEKYWANSDPKIATKLILGMMTSVGVWYRSDGPVALDGIVKIYQSMIENLLSDDIDTAKMTVQK
ncbi:MAG: TetR/AcrR family transcriptional regulator [Sneathiella sp.]